MEQKRKSDKGHLIWEIVSWALVSAVFVFVFTSLILKFTNTTFYWWGKYRNDVVLTDSMSVLSPDRDDYEHIKDYSRYQVGDLVTSEKINEDTALELYDVVLFQSPYYSVPVCHRIVSIRENSNGVSFYTIQADKASQEDGPDGTFTREVIISKVTAVTPKIGYIIRFFKSTYGIAAIIGLTLIVTIAEAAIKKSEEKEKKAEQIGKDVDTSKKDENE